MPFKFIITFTVIFFLFTEEASAEICWDPLSVEEPDSIDNHKNGKLRDKKGRGKGKDINGSGFTTSSGRCENDPPTPKPGRAGTPSVSVANTTSGTYTVSWSASSSMSTSPREGWGYELAEYKNGSYVKKYTTSPTTRTYSISSNPDGNYQYKVRGCNHDYKMGVLVCGNYSSLSSVNYVRHKPSKPSAPSSSSSTSTGSITLNMTKPSGNVAFYRIQKRKNSDGWAWADSNHANNSKVISGLTDGSWDFRFTACNDYTWACSSYSSDSANVTVRNKPSVPTSPAVADTTVINGSISISWTKPSGSVSMYDVIEYKAGVSGYKVVANDISATSLSLTGRSSGDYTYRVRACNGYGWSCSGYSSHSTATKVRLLPSKPAVPTVSSTTSTGSVSVSWSKPSGSVSFYRIQKRLNGGSWAWADSSHSATSLTITGLTEGGWDFRVNACNGYSWACSSFSTDSANVAVRIPPSTPAAPSINDTTVNGSVTVSWGKPSGNVSFYRLQKRKNNGSWAWADSNQPSTSKTVSGLTDGSWDFRVQACNGGTWSCSGLSADSANTTVRVKPSAPASPSIANTTVTNGTLSLSWSKPSGAVTMYDVLEYKSGISGYTVVANDTTSTSLTLSNRSDGDYTYRVRACNGYDWACSGYSGHSVSAKVRLIPSKPATPTLSSATNTGSVTVSWSKPSGSVSFYKIQKRKNGGSWAWADSNHSSTSLSISGLTDGSWDFRVQACNSYSWSCSVYSNDSANTTARAKPSVPSAPAVPSATSTDGVVALSWSKPSGTVTKYDVIEYKSGQSGYSVVGHDVTATSLTLSGRSDGNYTYRVRACNEFSWACSGYSNHSASTSVLHKPGAPASISGPTLTDVDGTHTITWGASGGQIDSYELRQRFKSYGSSSYGAWSTVYDGTGRSKYFSLSNDGEYDYAVRACNNSGCSNFKYVSPHITVLKTPYRPSVSVNSSSSDGVYTVSWQSGGGIVDEYHYSESPNYDSWISAGTATSRVISGKSDGSWSYKVKACNTSGCGSHGTSNTVTVNHPTPDTPASIETPVETAEASYSISWDPSTSTDLDYYQISQQHEANGWSGWTKVTGNSAQVIVDKAGGWKHRVRACNELPDLAKKCSSVRESGVVDVKLPPDWGKAGGEVADKNYGHNEGLISDETVGSVEGSGGVSGGAATYNVPVVIPPGRKGMQPQISLNYSSRSGSGLAGVGWSLSAGSSISRCGSTHAQDTKTKAVTFQNDDKLCLDGQRLIVVSGNYGSSGAIYRTEMDSFVRVTQLGGGINSGASFKVEYKNNRVSFYGKSTDSKHIPGSLSEPLSWAISSQEDRSGNNIVYSYDSWGSGEYTLKDIKYTGKGSTIGNRKVTFNYATRPDFSRSYLAGGLTLRTKRLSSISTFVGSSAVRTYNLGYQVSSHTKRSILRNIQECSASGACLKPTVFDTYKPAMAWDNKDSRSSANRAIPGIAEVGGNDRVEHKDLDGDGVPETLYQTAQYNNQRQLVGYTTKVYTRNINGKDVLAYDGDTNNDFIYPAAINMGDLNSDGITDFFTVNASNEVIIKQFESNGDPVNPKFSFVDMTTNITMTSDYQRNRRWGASTLVIRDLNGDGYQDFAYVDDEYKIQAYFNNADNPTTFSGKRELTALQVRSIYNSDRPETPSYQDVDGDGVVDIVRVGQSEVTASVMSVDFGRINSSGYWVVDETKSSSQLNLPINHYNNQYVFADLNGDGLLDYVRAVKSGGFYWAVRLNKGDRTFANEVSLNTSLGIHEHNFLNENLRISTRVQALWGGLRVADLDNDGVDELLVATGSNDEVCVNFSGNLNETGSFEPYTTKTCNDALHAVETPVDSHPGHYIDIDWARYDVRRFNWSVIDFKSTLTGITHERTIQDVVKAPISTFVTLDGSRSTGLQLKDIDNNGFIDFTYNVMTSFVQGTQSTGGWITVGGTNYYRAILSVSFGDGSPPYASGYFEQKNIMGLGADEGRLADTAYQVTDGVGNIYQWNYAPLSRRLSDRSTDNPFYWVPKSISERYLGGNNENFYFSSSMYVVSDSKTSNGVGGLNSKKYSYREAVYNRAGRGFQGFKTIAIEDIESRIRSVSDFHQLYPKSGKIQSARTCLITDDANCSLKEPLTKTTVQSYHVKDTVANGKVKWVYPAKTIKQSYDLYNRSRELSYEETTIGNSSLDVDDYGNILKSTKTVDNGFDKVQTVTNKTYTVDDTNWWLNKVTMSRTDVSKSRASTETGVASGTDIAQWNKTTYSYNPQGNLHRIPTGTVTTASGSSQTHTTSIVLNTDGLPTSVKTSGAQGASTGSDLNRTVSTVYSTDGYFPETVTNPKGHQTTAIVSPEHGQAASVTDANGITVSHTYDAFGRLKSSTVPGGKLVETGYKWCYSSCPYQASGAVYYEFTQQEGSPTVKVYKDSFNRAVMTETQGFGVSSIYTRTGYDELGRKTLETKPSFYSSSEVGTRYTGYDVLGRLLSKETDQADSYIMHSNYQYEGHKTNISVTDRGDMLTMSRTYAGDGKLMKTTDAMGGETRYAYDSMGNPITLTDPNANSIYAWHNGFGHKWKVSDPNMGVKTFAYNTYGEVESETDANGDILTMRYDALGRLEYRWVNGTEHAHYVYDNRANGIGVLGTETGQGIEKVYSYDSLTRPSSVTTTIGDKSYTSSTSYDGNYGRVKAYTYASGITVGYDYDDYGYQTKVYNAKSGYEYQKVEQRDALLNITEAYKNANSLRETRVYSEATGQLRNIYTHTRTGEHLKHNLGYVYGSFGNLSIQDQWSPSGVSTESYGYDKLHRLINSSRSGFASDQASMTYTYDAVGNITHKSDYATTLDYTGSGGPNAVSSITKLDGSVVNFTYDANGNMRTGDGKTITYNAFNKPVTINAGGVTSTFNYGADLARYKQVKGTETTLYIGKEVDITLKGNTTTTKTYIDDIAIVSKTETAGKMVPDHKIRFIHRDRLGSVMTLTNHENTIMEQRSYDAFGKPRTGEMKDPLAPTLQGALSDTPYAMDVMTDIDRGFTDHEHLDDAQLIHMNGRAYDYNLGRFLSVDPFIQFTGNSQSINPYSYIMNNPLAGTDPSGYLTCNANQSVGDCGLKGGQTAEIVDDDGNSLGTASLSEDGKTLTAEGNNGVNSTITASSGKLVQTNTSAPEQIGSQGQVSVSDNTNNICMTASGGGACGGSNQTAEERKKAFDKKRSNLLSHQYDQEVRSTEEQDNGVVENKHHYFSSDDKTEGAIYVNPDGSILVAKPETSEEACATIRAPSAGQAAAHGHLESPTNQFTTVARELPGPLDTDSLTKGNVMYIITPTKAVRKLEVIKTDDGTFEPRLTTLDRGDKYRSTRAVRNIDKWRRNWGDTDNYNAVMDRR